MPNETEPQRIVPRRAADGSSPQLRPSGKFPLVTSARICVVERASSKGSKATGSPWSEANRALVTVFYLCVLNDNADCRLLVA